MNKIVVENRKFQIDLVIIKNINHNLEKLVYLEEKKKQAKGEKCSCRNNVVISSKYYRIPDDDFKNTMVSICKYSRVEIRAISYYSL